MSGENLYFNGIDATSGGYALPPMSLAEMARRVRGLPAERGRVDRFRWKGRGQGRGLPDGVDVRDLAQTGWGVIFAQGDVQAAAVRQRLRTLLELRRRQVGDSAPHRYRELIGERGYRAGESKQDFLARFGLGAGPVDPDKMPYYLLLVGSPQALPYPFQYQLDVAYAVGRIHFETLDEYERYAEAVVAAEAALEVKAASRPRRAVFFAPRNDPATELSADHFAAPLAEEAGKTPGWEVATVLGNEASKARLGQLLGGEETPELLFTAGHGTLFHNGDPRQREHQGA
nr:hypothetical protein [Acidobacteriota bacterium]